VDDTGIFGGTTGNWSLVAREGDIAPGTGGSTFGAVSGQSMQMNNSGQLLFTNSLVGGGTPGTSLWSWDAVCGLQPVFLQGDMIEYTPRNFATVTSVGGIQFNNGNGRPLSFNDNGTTTLRLSMAGGLGAIAKVTIGCIPAPTPYCTAGISTNNCVPSIGFAGTPSVAAASGFTIDVANVEGNKQGLLYYGLTGATALVWGPGSTSFQCVKSPTQRMGILNTGGASGTCTGALTQDWLTFLNGHPAAYGQPFGAGITVNAQAWYRDPLAVKTTNLSNALQFTTVP